MSILVTGDIHLNDNPRDSHRWDIFDWFIDLAAKKAENVIILGDLTTEKDRHSAWLVNELVYQFRELSKQAQVYIDKGNHDYIDPTNPFFAFLNQIPHIRWINNPTSTTIEGLKCLFLPHTRNYKKDWDGPLSHDYDWIFAHNTFEGAASESGRHLSGIPQTIFRKGAKVVSGDVHVPQELDKVIYVGAPYRINFGDSYTPHVMLIHDKKAFEYIKCPGPYKQLVTIKSPQSLNWGKLRKGDILKIKVKLKPEDKDRWQEIRREVYTAAEKLGLVVDQVIPATTIQAKQRRVKQTHASDEELIRNYVKRRNASEAFGKAGMEYLK